MELSAESSRDGTYEVVGFVAGTAPTGLDEPEERRLSLEPPKLGPACVYNGNHKILCQK